MSTDERSWEEVKLLLGPGCPFCSEAWEDSLPPADVAAAEAFRWPSTAASAALPWRLLFREFHCHDCHPGQLLRAAKASPAETRKSSSGASHSSSSDSLEAGQLSPQAQGDPLKLSVEEFVRQAEDAESSQRLAEAMKGLTAGQAGMLAALLDGVAASLMIRERGSAVLAALVGRVAEEEVMVKLGRALLLDSPTSLKRYAANPHASEVLAAVVAHPCVLPEQRRALVEGLAEVAEWPRTKAASVLLAALVSAAGPEQRSDLLRRLLPENNTQLIDDVLTEHRSERWRVAVAGLAEDKGTLERILAVLQNRPRSVFRKRTGVRFVRAAFERLRCEGRADGLRQSVLNFHKEYRHRIHKDDEFRPFVKLFKHVSEN